MCIIVSIHFTFIADYSYVKCSNNKLIEIRVILNNRIQNLGNALNIDMNPVTDRRDDEPIGNEYKIFSKCLFYYFFFFFTLSSCRGVEFDI